MTLYDRIQEAKEYVVNKFGDARPKLAIVLGTGLGDFVNQVEVVSEIPFRAIPNFPATSVVSHKGKIILATLHGVELLIIQGRYHYYEGYNMETVTLPVRLVQALGIKDLILTNAAGGLNPDFEEGDVVAITDHINLHSENPLRGANDDRLGIRFPDMKETYNLEMISGIQAAAKKENILLNTGVYVGLAGPNLETPAEYKYLNIIGGDLVGMSTIPEAIVAKHAGLRLAALSIVSNVCYPPDKIKATTVQDVIHTVENSSHKLFKILASVISVY